MGFDAILYTLLPTDLLKSISAGDLQGSPIPFGADIPDRLSQEELREKVRKQRRGAANCVRKRKGEMQIKLEKELLSNIVMKYSEPAFIGNFNEKQLLEKLLR